MRKAVAAVRRKNEIIIIHDEESSNGPPIAKFARQFSTHENIVRILGYKASRPLQAFGISKIFLEIRDKEINHVPDIETSFECRYKIMARELLESIQFTNDEIKGIIIIQSSEISKEVINEMLEKVFFSEPDFRIYKVNENFNTSYASKVHIPISKVFDVRVKRWRVLAGIGAEYFSEICKVSTKVHCPDGYKCASSKTCIPTEQVCDGFKNCLHGDDEVFCDFQCPYKCKCVGFISNCSATDFNITKLHTVPKKTRSLDFSLNKKLSPILEESLLNIRALSILSLSGCDIERLYRNAFERIRNLLSLDLSFNNLTTLSSYVFNSLKHLKILNLRGNFQLSVIEIHAFAGLSLIQNLDLANAKLVKVRADTFSGLTLRKLDLSNNKLEELEDFTFRDSSIEDINFKGNGIKNFNKEIFTGLIGLKKLVTPAFKFCCIRPNYVQEVDCYPQKDEFSSCDDLMRHSVLQFLIWLIGITAFLGNFFTVIYRVKYDRKRLKLGFGIFVTNLAVADFLMAIYLIIIAVADSAFRKRYIFVDDYWRHSVWCNLAGILSTISSEASVLFLCLITLDRLLVIKFPFGGAKMSPDKAVTCVIFTWLFSTSVAIFPVAYEGYFKNEFYSKSGVCIALPLTGDRPSGWAYSLTIFVCLNFVTFLLVAVGQLSIFIEIRKSAGIATSVESARKRDLKVARNLLLVVATDFLCWFPIGVLGMLALTGYAISGEVYAWAAVFILPVNSALNPILYTLSAIIGKKSFNPSTNEQSLTKISKEIGENAIRCFIVSRRLTAKKTLPKFQGINELPEEYVHITVDAILAVAAKLAQTLDATHSNSLGIKCLDVTTVIVGIANKKLTGAVKIKGEPFISYKPEDKTNNINQLGVLLRSLLAARERKRVLQ
ncbi:G-protein coupled receptor GRL101-like isoform X1 [Mercenaria mercenaria]|uniref:G-protein coupled receptor GRL101-like isoform X1 n=1 Tax=Mercenaria mercenaria TaxID=6596 RepID=UPI00234E8E3F|nr:G-protein coupled receptor GRL101-like isoform X1 [Mercenaria mercenaria]